MKRLLSAVVSLALVLGLIISVPVSAAEASGNYDGRIETVFNNDWQFWRESSKSTDTTLEGLTGKSSTWENVNLPHDFSIETPFSKVDTYSRSGCLQGGTGWYKKDFSLPAELENKQIVINFDGVYSYSYVYVNGTLVGSNVMGYVAFTFDITDYLYFGYDKTNEIVVKVINSLPSERWYPGSGIYRDVTLTVTDKVHVDYRGTSVSMPNLASTGGEDGTLKADVTLKNDSASSVTATVKTTIEKDGLSVGSSAQKDVTVAAGEKSTVSLAPAVTNPSLWSVDSPNLYNLKTEVIVDGKTVDTYNTEFGYKYLEFDKTSGFFLNGEPMKLKGVALHNDFGASLGSKAYKTAEQRYISLIKDMGCNAIRTAHQPLSENFMNLCAKMGIMVFDEVFDEWVLAKFTDGNGNYSNYFKQGIDSDNKLLLTEDMGESDVSGWSDATAPTWAEFALKSTLMRDRNNAAVIIWGLGNELFQDTTYDSTVAATYPKIGKSFNEWVDSLDPQNRPTCIGDNYSGDSSVRANLQNTMDIIGLNYKSDINAYDTSKAMFNTEAVDECTERGVYDKTNLNKDLSNASNYQFSSYNNDDRGWAEYGYESWGTVVSNDRFMGQFVWAGIDYLGEACDYGKTHTGIEYPNTTYCGAYDSCGFAKDTMYLFRAIWNENDYTSDMLPGTWNESEVVKDSNGYVPVHVYSNADKVQILLNGEVVAEGTAVVNKTSNTSRTNYTQRVWTATAVNTNVCTTDKIVTGDFTKNYLQFKIKYAAGTLELKSYSKNADGTYTEITDAKGTQCVTTNSGIEKLDVKQSATEITANNDSIVYYEISAQTNNGDFVNGYNGRVKLTVEGEGELIGTDNGSSRSVIKGASEKVISDNGKTAIVDAYNGKALAVVRSTDKSGSFTVTATAYSGNDETDSSAVVDTVKTNTVNVIDDMTDDEFEEVFPEHTHTYTSVVTPPTCTQRGYTTYTCTDCDAVKIGDYTAALGHQYDGNGKCTVCGAMMPVNVTINGNTTSYDYGTQFTFPAFENDGDVAYKDADGKYYYPGDDYGKLTADVTFTAVNLSFRMEKGASIRIGDYNGIRFYSSVDTALIDELRAKGAKISMGTLIAPEDRISDKANFTKDSGKEGEDYVDVRFESDNWYDNGSFKGLVGSIVSLQESNINRNYIARGYITIEIGSTEKTIYASYSDDDIKNNTRSICYVANRVMLSSYYATLTSDRREIVKSYADKYTGLDKYTLLDPNSDDIF